MVRRVPAPASHEIDVCLPKRTAFRRNDVEMQYSDVRGSQMERLIASASGEEKAAPVRRQQTLPHPLTHSSEKETDSSRDSGASRGIQPSETESAKLSKVGTGRALLIATDDYDEWTPLQNPVHDAETIGTELHETYGFDVRLVRNPTKTKILQELHQLAAAHYDEGDQLFIFVAGHGTFNETFGPDMSFLVTGAQTTSSVRAIFRTPISERS